MKFYLNRKKSEMLLCKHAILFLMRPLLNGLKNANHLTLFLSMKICVFQNERKQISE